MPTAPQRKRERARRGAYQHCWGDAAHSGAPGQRRRLAGGGRRRRGRGPAETGALMPAPCECGQVKRACGTTGPRSADGPLARRRRCRHRRCAVDSHATTPQAAPRLWAVLLRRRECQRSSAGTTSAHRGEPTGVKPVAERPGERRNILRARRLQREREQRTPGSHSDSGAGAADDSQCAGCRHPRSSRGVVECRGVRHDGGGQP